MFPRCTAAIQSALLPAAYSNTSLLNNFKSQRQLWPIHTLTPLKPSIHPSIPLSVPPLIPFHSGTIRSLSQSQPWPGPKAVQGLPELSCELSTFPPAPFPLQFAGSPSTQTPSLPILGGFWMRALICSGCSYARFTGHV